MLNRAGYFSTLHFCVQKKMTMGSSLNSEPIVIKQFHSNEGALYGAEKVGNIVILIKEFNQRTCLRRG